MASTGTDSTRRNVMIGIWVIIAALVVWGFVACSSAINATNTDATTSTTSTTVSGDLNSPANQAKIRAGAIQGLRDSGCLPANWTDGEALPNPPLKPGCPTG